MEQSREDLKALLKAAEEKIGELLRENESFSKAFGDMMEAQQLEAEQMAALAEQVWALEEALASTSMDKEAALAKLMSLSRNMKTMQSQMKETLDAASENASRMELAARVYEMAASAQDEELNRQLEEYNARISAAK